MSEAGLPPSQPNPLQATAVRLLLFIGVALAIYAPALRSYYIWDDDLWIVYNPNLRGVDGLKRTWLEPRTNQEYYPLTNTVFWAEYQVWDLNPVGYHVANVVLHAIVAWLIWILLQRLRISGAGLAAAIFLVHPVNVETAAWVTEHKNTLSGICLLTATMAFARAYRLEDDARHSPKWGWLLLSALLYAMAVLAKTVAVTLPGALLVILWWKRGRVSWRDLLAMLPYLAVGLPLAGFAVWMQRTHTGATGVEFALTLPQRMLVAGRAPWFYLGKLAWPWPLAFVYPKWQLDPGQWWQWLFPIATIGLLVSLWQLRTKLGRGPMAAVLIFGGMLLPALGFFNVYWHRYTYVADHVQYHASIAILSLVAAGVTLLVRQRVVRIAGAAIVLVTFAGLTTAQSWYYYDNERLMRRTAQLNPESSMPHDNLAHCLLDKGKNAEAVDEFRLSLKYSPEWPWRQSKAEHNLAVALTRTGQLPEAVDHYRAAIKADPQYALAHYDLATILLQQNQLDQAITHFQKVVGIEPDHLYAWNQLGQTLTTVGRFDDAIAAYQKALQLAPDFGPAKVGLQTATYRRDNPSSR